MPNGVKIPTALHIAIIRRLGQPIECTFKPRPASAFSFPNVSSSGEGPDPPEIPAVTLSVATHTIQSTWGKHCRSSQTLWRDRCRSVERLNREARERRGTNACLGLTCRRRRSCGRVDTDGGGSKYNDSKSVILWPLKRFVPGPKSL